MADVNAAASVQRDSPSLRAVKFGKPESARFILATVPVVAIVLQLLHEVRREMGRVDQLQQSALGVGVRDDCAWRESLRRSRAQRRLRRRP